MNALLCKFSQFINLQQKILLIFYFCQIGFWVQSQHFFLLARITNLGYCEVRYQIIIDNKMNFPTNQSFPRTATAAENVTNMHSILNSAQNPNQDLYSSKINAGRWTQKQCQLFCQLYSQIGKDWREIARFIPTRTAEQVRSHAQKYLSRKLRKQTEQMEIQQAQRLLKQGTSQRTTRGLKNRHNFNMEQQAQRAFSTSLQKNEINRKKNKTKDSLDGEYKESSSIKQFEHSNQQIQESGQNFYRTSPSRSERIKTEPLIPIPLQNTSSYDFEMIYDTRNTSYLFQLLLPNLLAGGPFPIFIYDSKKGQSQNLNYNSQSNQSKQRATSSLNSLNKERKNMILQKSQSKTMVNQGFVKVERINENKVAHKAKTTQRVDTKERQEKIGNIFVSESKQFKTELLQEERKSFKQTQITGLNLKLD